MRALSAEEVSVNTKVCVGPTVSGGNCLFMSHGWLLVPPLQYSAPLLTPWHPSGSSRLSWCQNFCEPWFRQDGQMRRCLPWFSSLSQESQHDAKGDRNLGSCTPAVPCSRNYPGLSDLHCLEHPQLVETWAFGVWATIFILKTHSALMEWARQRL